QRPRGGRRRARPADQRQPSPEVSEGDAAGESVPDPDGEVRSECGEVRQQYRRARFAIRSVNARGRHKTADEAHSAVKTERGGNGDPAQSHAFARASASERSQRTFITMKVRSSYC